MAEQRSLVGFFQSLIAEQVIQLAAGVTVGAVVAGPAGAVAVPLAAKAIEYYGIPIANNLLEWVRKTPSADACLVLAEVANLPAPDALRMAETAVSVAMPQAGEANKAHLTSYLAGVSASLRQSLPRGDNGLSTCPAALLPRTQDQALRMLPVHLPPYQTPCDLPGTDYRLVRLLGTGGFGAVYEARLRSEPLSPRVLKFCLDPERVDVLRHERRGFQRILDQTNQGENWPSGIVRFLGDNLNYEKPFLVFEYVPDGDLSLWVENHRLRAGRRLNADEVLALIERIARAVGELHRVGLTHCDVKPANVLFARQEPRIADLGLGAVAPLLTANISRQGTRTATVLDLRGAGTYLYSAPEQLRGAAPLPTQDIYSLGVIWYQLLIEDFTRAPGPSWRKQLASKGVPETHLALLETCLEEEPSERFRDAGTLFERIQILRTKVDEAEQERNRQERALAEQAAREEQAKAQAEKAVETAWQQAGATNTVECWKQFLADYPNHPRYTWSAQYALANLLRERCLAEPHDKKRRVEYVAVRTAEWQQADRQTGRSWLLGIVATLVIALAPILSWASVDAWAVGSAHTTIPFWGCLGGVLHFAQFMFVLVAYGIFVHGGFGRWWKKGPAVGEFWLPLGGFFLFATLIHGASLAILWVLPWFGCSDQFCLFVGSFAGWPLLAIAGGLIIFVVQYCRDETDLDAVIEAIQDLRYAGSFSIIFLFGILPLLVAPSGLWLSKPHEAPSGFWLLEHFAPANTYTGTPIHSILLVAAVNLVVSSLAMLVWAFLQPTARIRDQYGPLPLIVQGEEDVLMYLD